VLLLGEFMEVIKVSSLAPPLLRKDIEVMHPELEVKLRPAIVEAKFKCLLDFVSKHLHGST